MEGSAMADPTTQVLYSCNLCGTVDRVVTVLSRGADEPVEKFMGRLIRVIAQDHWLRCPACQAKEIKEAKIPLSKDDPRIGASAPINPSMRRPEWWRFGG